MQLDDVELADERFGLRHHSGSVTMAPRCIRIPACYGAWRRKKASASLERAPAISWSMEKGDFEPARQVDLSTLRTISFTGSPLPAASYGFIYRDIKEDVQVSSISGGTDIVSCFGLGCPLLPVYPGELQCLGLGMRVEVFNEVGTSVLDEPGELVCTAPFPAMPTGFWNDADGHKYHAAYYERYANVWHHGDHALITSNNGLVILGRSDTMLKPGGVRIGTGELYSALAGMPGILEALAVGQRFQDDVRIVLFVMLAPGVALTSP